MIPKEMRVETSHVKGSVPSAVLLVFQGTVGAHICGCREAG